MTNFAVGNVMRVREPVVTSTRPSFLSVNSASRMAVPRVPVYRAMFERIAAKKNKLVAITAVARRMLEDAFTMLRRDEAFRYVEPPAASLPASAPSSDRKVASSVAG